MASTSIRILVSPVTSDSSIALAQSAGSMVDVTVSVVGSMVALDLTTIVLAIGCGVAVGLLLGFAVGLLLGFAVGAVIGAVVTGAGTVVGVGVGAGS
ncbi:hypothetical protein D3C73_1301750 [compost metagenome]